MNSTIIDTRIHLQKKVTIAKIITFKQEIFVNSLFLFAFVMIMLSSCSNSEGKGSIDECVAVLKEAESSEVIENHLPCGLKFGITRAEMDSLLEEQAKDPKSKVKKVGDSYHYMFEANNKQYECVIISMELIRSKPINCFAFVFDNVELRFKGKKDDIFNDFKEEYKELDFASCYVGDGERVKDKVYCWRFQNMAMVLTDFFSLSFEIYNAPIEKPTQKLDFISRFANKVSNDLKKQDAQKKKIGKVMNSPFDGSVYQVKKFLNSTLTDPNSYDGISWREVQKTNEGYSVYHKYKKKNSLGNYIIEEHVFLIKKDGSIQIAQ